MFGLADGSPVERAPGIGGGRRLRQVGRATLEVSLAHISGVVTRHLVTQEDTWGESGERDDRT